MDLLTSDSSTMLCAPSKRNGRLLPCFSMLASKILLMPIGTAELEKSFSTMNRILRSERCRLLPEHVDILVKISIEGPGIPHVRRDGTKAEEAALNLLLDKVVNEWKKVSHRETDLQSANCVITHDVGLLLTLSSNAGLLRVNLELHKSVGGRRGDAGAEVERRRRED